MKKHLIAIFWGMWSLKLWVKYSGVCELSSVFSCLLDTFVFVWIGLSDFHLTNLEVVRMHRGISEQLCHNAFRLFSMGTVKYVWENQIVYIRDAFVFLILRRILIMLNFLFFKADLLCKFPPQVFIFKKCKSTGKLKGVYRIPTF